ncbi:carboxypeptidase-like regulatory domain-containing protein [uncultured Kordia sp.]|uniref:carboxypeptidase-like regulatory domain-containing protein n=1 Tax=uncultured Kordia sp. TaxID=507699 RepID=UPI00260CFDCF|nr:carboxypeptidase-like regulatory domain-containing protein [uncultured Kordia sp.]
MKDSNLIVQIAEPCHENWKNMSPTEKGRFCKACTKEVIDFTSKSDEEIITHVNNHGNACGRFYASQLNRKLIADRKKRNHWLSYAATLLLPMTLFSQQTKSAEKKTSKTEQLDTLKFKTLHISALNRTKPIAQKEKSTKTMTVIGTVHDDSGIPLPAATVIVKGTTTGKATDFDGIFSIKVTSGDILVVDYVGYKTKEIKILADVSEYKIEMIPDENALLEVVVVGGYRSCDTTSYPSTHIETAEAKVLKERTKNYFEFQRKKWKEKRAQRRAERAARKAEKQANNN